jgi:lysophospholipase L1-like esterase
MIWLVLALLVTQFALSPVPPTPPPASTTGHRPRIVFFGDSLTAGLHASQPDLTYRALLMRQIAGTLDAGDDAAVIEDPLGLLDDAQRRLPQVLAEHPSLVFVELGHHDIWADDTQMGLFEARYADILDRLLASGAEVIPSTLAWLNYAPGSPQYVNALRANSIIRRLAAQRDLVVADLWSPTVGRADLISTPNDPSFVEPFQGDDLHPNDAGHRVLADAFWRAYRALRTRPPLARPVAV